MGQPKSIKKTGLGWVKNSSFTVPIPFLDKEANHLLTLLDHDHINTSIDGISRAAYRGSLPTICTTS